MSVATYVGPWDSAPEEPDTPREPPRDERQPGDGAAWPCTSRRGWPRALLFLLVTAVAGLVLAQIPVGGLVLFAELSGRGMTWIDVNVLDADAMPPLTLLMVNLTLACVAPAALIAGRLVYGLRPGQLLSSAGRWRWGLVGRTALCVVPVWLGYLVVTTTVDGLPAGGPPPQVTLLVTVAVLTTPLQVLGEEVLFRLVPLVVFDGLVGARRLAVGRGLAGVVATGGFVLAHGSSDVAVDASLAAFALVAAYLTITSEGLEQAWTVHLTNNLCTQLSAILLGGWGSSFIGQGDDATSTTSWTTLAAVPTLLVVTLLVRRLGRPTRGPQPPGVSSTSTWSPRPSTASPSR